MTTNDHILEVVQAHKDGKKIYRMSDLHPEWVDCTENPEWNFVYYSYRVAPERPKPREWRLYEYNGKWVCVNEGWIPREPNILVREVIE
jgi:hypothetical protein